MTIPKTGQLDARRPDAASSSQARQCSTSRVLVIGAQGVLGGLLAQEFETADGPLSGPGAGPIPASASATSTWTSPRPWRRRSVPPTW